MLSTCGSLPLLVTTLAGGDYACSSPRHSPSLLPLASCYSKL
ncbi:MAG: hypothetical protein ACK55Z_11925 [bacterium]